MKNLTLTSQPWLPVKVIQFLDQFLQQHHHAAVLEFGSGASTIWFAQRTHNLVSIEHDQRWYNQVQPLVQQFGIDYRLIVAQYYTECDKLATHHFDLILLDGKDRVACAQRCERLLKPGGILMLDNSERENYKPIFEQFKEWPQPQVTDMVDGKQHYTTWWVKPN